MTIFQIIGIIVLAGLFIFILLLLLYRIFKKESRSFILSENMPVLRPISIPTKNRTFFMRILVWLFDVRKWRLEENWIFNWKDSMEIILPRGFTFDGASIPRLFWFFLSPVGLMLIPGLLHDYGYKYNQLWKRDAAGHIIPYMEQSSRKDWDTLLKDTGYYVNGFAIIDWIAWFGVRIGGWLSWKKHRKEDEKAAQPIFD